MSGHEISLGRGVNRRLPEVNTHSSFYQNLSLQIGSIEKLHGENIDIAIRVLSQKALFPNLNDDVRIAFALHYIWQKNIHPQVYEAFNIDDKKRQQATELAINFSDRYDRFSGIVDMLIRIKNRKGINYYITDFEYFVWQQLQNLEQTPSEKDIVRNLPPELRDIEDLKHLITKVRNATRRLRLIGELEKGPRDLRVVRRRKLYKKLPNTTITELSETLGIDKPTIFRDRNRFGDNVIRRIRRTHKEVEQTREILMIAAQEYVNNGGDIKHLLSHLTKTFPEFPYNLIHNLMKKYGKSFDKKL